MNDKIIAVENKNYKVITSVVNQYPLAFVLDVYPHEEGLDQSHPSHSESMTIGDSHLSVIPSQKQLQEMVDAARERAAETCHKKSKLSALLLGLE